MSLGYKNNINAAVTAVSNTFIDEYMGTASGEYVKVYLYLLRHEGENIEIPDIADALKEKGCDAYYFSSFEDIQDFCVEKCQKGDLLITMGAGDVVNIGEELLKR